MDQLIFASLSHAHYWYEVGMLKVPATYSIHLWKQVFDGLVTYSSKVKRINRGYGTHYTIKLTLRIRTNYSNMIIVLR